MRLHENRSRQLISCGAIMSPRHVRRCHRAGAIDFARLSHRLSGSQSAGVMLARMASACWRRNGPAIPPSVAMNSLDATGSRVYRAVIIITGRRITWMRPLHRPLSMDMACQTPLKCFLPIARFGAAAALRQAPGHDGAALISTSIVIL